MSSEASRAAAGLSAGELHDALTELAATVLPAEVVDIATLQGKDDLVLFVRPLGRDAPSKVALHLVPGGVRGRATTTARRFARDEFASGPGADHLRGLLAGATLTGAEALPRERIARFLWRRSDGTSGALVLELFGNRGLWGVLDANGRIVAQSRVPHVEDRKLAPQTTWQPPPPRPPGHQPTSRFAPPVLAAIDAWFTARDQAAEIDDLRATCARALLRLRTRAEHKVAGLRRQLDGPHEAPRLRANADLMLAYAHQVRRGATSMRVPDPDSADAEIELPLQPDKPVVMQAQALYERARRLTDAVVHAQQRLAQAQVELDAIGQLEARLSASVDFAALQALRHDLGRGAAPTKGGVKAKPKTKAKPGKTADEAYRRFVSREGYEILCGKTNAQNDRLSVRTARGNDVWLHIGRGHAGSHVVVRVPKGKSASLETLLDAAQIAVHFSKARGAAKAEVIYTQAKYVRKPKGAPPGQVVPSHTKTLFVRLDEARLQELLAGSGDEP